MTSRLPVELVREILASIEDPEDDDDLTAMYTVSPILIACSLVCHAWNDICRPRIFSKIVINQDTAGLLDRLSFLHFTAPYLTRYIVCLHLWWDDDVTLAPPWVSDCFVQMRNLTSLCLIWDPSTTVAAHIALSTLGIMSLIPELCLKELALVGWRVDEDGSDILPFLSACSTSLDELVILITHTFDHGASLRPADPSIIRLEALRELVVIGKGDRLPRIDAIECPNLRSLTIEHLGDGSWAIPPKISDKLVDLTVTAPCSSLIPELGQRIRPSELKLEVQKESDEAYRSAMVWIRDCIARLPFPCAIRELVIEIANEEGKDLDALDYPSLADYEELYRAVRSLAQHGALRNMDVTVKTYVASGKVYEDDHEGEAAKLDEAFGPLLRTGKMTVNLTLDQTQD
ncbi:hypothetical protein PLEOSDRAFT_160090 [Pleurotus ostreatus PC15]|uniref:F-box domain-containing protein n=1 Tax=Pleurotus ostreatus (strain PC15) TaxID=1137138 RepID=A0A067NMV3_PLEO1|nr:hypothetical protein PLEOSDRAFT_160090 [Pleurotus ostreatus PC15]